MSAILTAVLLAASLVAAPQDAGIPADAKSAIAAANAAWLPAMKAGDAWTIAAPYADDGMFVTATGVVAKGRDGVAQLMRDRFAQSGKVTGGQLVQDGMTRQGTMIYEWGHATISYARAGAAPAGTSRARYLTVWRKGVAGRWEIVRNLSLPD